MTHDGKDYSGRFIMMPKSIKYLYSQLPYFDSDAENIYGWLIDMNNDKYGYAFPSVDTLQDLSGLSRHKVLKSLKALARAELIRIEKVVRDRKGGYCNHYFLLPPRESESDFYVSKIGKDAIANREKRHAIVERRRSNDKERLDNYLGNDYSLSDKPPTDADDEEYDF